MNIALKIHTWTELLGDVEYELEADVGPKEVDLGLSTSSRHSTYNMFA